MQSGLDSLRQRIDDVDAQLIELLNERAKLVIEVGRIKNTTNAPIYVPARERQVLERITQRNPGPLLDKTIQAIWRELMSGSIALERHLRVGFLGPEGTFSHLAATTKFGASVDYLPLPDIRSVFVEVARGHADLGVVPVENMLGGSVQDTLDAFVETQVMICGEILVTIRHHLLASCGLDQVHTIYSKPEVFSQCRQWIATTLPKAQQVPVASTSKAAEMASQRPHSAAIGSEPAAKLYGLDIVCANVEDKANNITRFLVLGQTDSQRTGDDKTTLLFATAHKAGALADVLDVLRQHEINMTNLQTRPNPRQTWEYCFFVDILGHREDAHVRSAVEQARQHCSQLSVLGSFPRALEPIC